MVRNDLIEKISNCEITIEDLKKIVKSKVKWSSYTEELINTIKKVVSKRKTNQVDAEYFCVAMRALYKIYDDTYGEKREWEVYLSEKAIFSRELIRERLESNIFSLLLAYQEEWEKDVTSDIDERLEKIDYLYKLKKGRVYLLKARICKMRRIVPSYCILFIDKENKKFLEFEGEERKGEKVKFYFKRVRVFEKRYKKIKEKLIKEGYAKVY